LHRDERAEQTRDRTCSAADTRTIGPVHGRKFTPAANDTAHASIRRSMPIRV